MATDVAPALRASDQAAAQPVPFRDAVRVWLYVGLNSFGGPAGQIAVMHRVLVERLGWVSEQVFLRSLNFCMLLPGPEAQQLATYIGWLLHGTRGALVAGALFILPGAVVLLVLSAIYATQRDTALVAGLFYGIKAAVIAVIALAVLRISARALHTRALVGIACVAFAAIFFLDVPFPLIILAAGVIGLAVGRRRPELLGRADATEAQSPVGAAREDGFDSWSRAKRLAGSMRTLAVGLAVWFAPVGAAALLAGPGSVFVALGLFFSFAAVVTFGGAYAVLAFVAQEAVGTYGWLAPSEMLDGLGMAEATPGPLIIVLEFVGFLAGYREPGAFPPLAGGLAGGVLVSWVTFVPSFLWILVGAPYVELLNRRRTLRTALAAITAAVVGVILDLGLWFALQTLFEGVGEFRLGPLVVSTVALGTLDLGALSLAVLSLLALTRLRWPMPLTIGAAALAGLGLRALTAGA